MFSGTKINKERQEAIRKVGGPHTTDTGDWNLRTRGGLRGCHQPWAYEPPAPKQNMPRASTAPASNRTPAITSTAETDLPSWENRARNATRGQPNPNQTSALMRGSGVDLSATIPLSGTGAAPAPGKWSTGNVDRGSWEARLAAGQMRGQADPFAQTTTEARPSSAPPAGAAPAAAPPTLNGTSTAALDMSSWEQRVCGKGPYGSNLQGTLRGNTIPNARGLGQGDVKMQQPQPITGGSTRRPATTLDTSTAATDTASWMGRLGARGRPAVRGQPDPWAQTLTESSARPGNALGAPGMNLTGISKGTTWSFAGGPSSTAAVDKRSWEQRLGQTSQGREMMSTFAAHGSM